MRPLKRAIKPCIDAVNQQPLSARDTLGRILTRSYHPGRILTRSYHPLRWDFATGPRGEVAVISSAATVHTNSAFEPVGAMVQTVQTVQEMINQMLRTVQPESASSAIKPGSILTKSYLPASATNQPHSERTVMIHVQHSTVGPV